MLFTTTYVQAQWEVQLDVQNFMHFDRIHFIDENLGWAIGSAHIGASPYFYTTDGGENWYIYEDWMAMDNWGTDIVFVNPDTGFIAAPNGIIHKTVNGGQIWTDIQTPDTQDVMRLFFVDENNGWATFLYNLGKLLHTSDGGNTWELQACMEVEESDVNTIFFLNDSTGYGGGGVTIDGDYNVLRKTTDEGESWETILSIPNFTYLFEDIFFTDTIYGWLVGQKNATNTFFILHTEDGGETWEEDTLPELTNWYGSSVEASIIYSIQFVNDTLGWLTCADEYSSGYILLTTDGGETWQQQFVNYNFDKPIFDICMVDNKNGWAVGADYIYHTNNGDTIIITDLNENIPEKNFFKIIPNPAKDWLSFEYIIPTGSSKATIEMFDQIGRPIFSFEVCQNRGVKNITLETVSSGTYLILFRVNGKIIEKQKIVITK